MPFKHFADFFDDVRKSGETLFSRITDKDTFKRVVYSGYLIANADGDFDQDEKSALAKLISKDLPQFNISDILDVLTEADEKIKFDKTLGNMELLDEIAKAKNDKAELIMRTAVYIGGADGEFDEDEKTVARDIGKRLNLNLENYGL